MKNFKKIMFGVCAVMIMLVTPLFLVGCGGSSSDDDDNPWGLVNAGQLILATSADFPPFQSINDAGEYVGIDIDIAAAIADALGLELVVQNMDFAGVLLSLHTGQSDIVLSGMTITEARRAGADFTIPYFNSGQVLITHVNNNRLDGMNADQIRAAMAGQRIGAVAGQTGYDHAIALTGASNVQVFTDNITMMTAIQNGIIDYSIQGAVASHGLVANNPNLQVVNVALTDEQYGAAVRQGNTELLWQVNRVLSTMMLNGELADIFANHGISL
ncbi:MAG: ABC transporter substrate-binding protein [Firmicutes bacterium]|nr:ABC transporter substrate-binding protein [Bacillota bacterium]